jgi:urease accessory protein
VSAAAAIALQRSRGEVAVRVGPSGLARLRESGAAKVRFPLGAGEAILINTGGGLAGGDRFTIDFTVEAGAALSVTTQAAEKVYRSLGEAARYDVTLRVEAGARLNWLPQETILFDGASLARTFTADLAGDATLLAFEAIVMGRAAMGETVRHARWRDRWRIRRDGRLIHADDIFLDGAPPRTKATLGDAGALAAVVLAGPGAESRIDAVRAAIGGMGAASAWSGKLVARLLAADGLALRGELIPALRLLMGGAPLPKVWSL